MVRLCYGPTLLWSDFVQSDFVMVRLCYGPSLLWSDLSVNPIVYIAIYHTSLNCEIKNKSILIAFIVYSLMPEQMLPV